MGFFKKKNKQITFIENAGGQSGMMIHRNA